METSVLQWAKPLTLTFRRARGSFCLLLPVRPPHMQPRVQALLDHAEGTGQDPESKGFLTEEVDVWRVPNAALANAALVLSSKNWKIYRWHQKRYIQKKIFFWGIHLCNAIDYTYTMKSSRELIVLCNDFSVVECCRSLYYTKKTHDIYKF